MPLISGKKTIVRAYISIESPAPVGVRGELLVGPTGSAPVTVYSSNQVTIDPSLNGQLRRGDVKLSLYFALPDAQTAVGSLQVQLSRVTDVSTAQDIVIGGAAAA